MRDLYIERLPEYISVENFNTTVNEDYVTIDTLVLDTTFDKRYKLNWTFHNTFVNVPEDQMVDTLVAQTLEDVKDFRNGEV